MYVISTLKRPVPLKHHVYLEGELYTVCSLVYPCVDTCTACVSRVPHCTAVAVAGTQLLDSNGNFMLRQYQEAAKVFKAKCDKKANSRGNPGGRNNAARYGASGVVVGVGGVVRVPP